MNGKHIMWTFININFIVILYFGRLCHGQAPSAVQRIYQKEACIWETFQAKCDSGKVIFIDEAFFGRVRESRCFEGRWVANEPSCSADVRAFVEKMCSGRRQCSIKMTNTNFLGPPSNCTKYVEKYLQVAYRCEIVYSAEDQSCVDNNPLVVRNSSGYLAKVITEETGKGSASCPWKFEPRSDQTVHLTLLDFGVWQIQEERDKRDICHIYARVRHVGIQPRIPDTIVCAGNQRERHIMTATTSVEIAVTRQSNVSGDLDFFMIKFQVFDCPELNETPSGAVFDKTGNGIRVYCSSDPQVSRELRCMAGRWEPPLNITCPTSSSYPPPSLQLTTSDSSCSEYNPSSDATANLVKEVSGRILVTCKNNEFFYVTCIDGNWDPPPKAKNCSNTVPPANEFKADSPGWEQIAYYMIPGLLVLFIVFAVVAAVRCRQKRIQKRKEKETCKISGQSVDNNSYYIAPLLPHNTSTSCRPTSEIYEELDENTINPRYSTCGAVPQSTCTMPRCDQQASWMDCSSERRADTLPLSRRLPEPHEYTTQLTRDSTYLMPREQEYVAPRKIVE